MFIRFYCNISSCFTDIIFATITYSLVFSFKLNSDLMFLFFQIITKEYFSFIEPSFQSKQIKNQPDKYFEKLDNCLPNIKLTIEVNPNKLLDTEIMFKNGITETSVVEKKSKIPNHWSSVVSKKYKQNAILGHRAHKISSNFKLEKQCIEKKYLNVNFPLNSIYSTLSVYFYFYQ